MKYPLQLAERIMRTDDKTWLLLPSSGVKATERPLDIVEGLQTSIFCVFVETEQCAVKRKHWIVLPYYDANAANYTATVNAALSGAMHYGAGADKSGFLKAHHMLQEGWRILSVGVANQIGFRTDSGYGLHYIDDIHGSREAMNTLCHFRNMWPFAEEQHQEAQLVALADKLANINADTLTNVIERMLKSTIADNEPRRDK